MVPLDDKGRINEVELRRYVDWLVQQGVHGLYPNGSTGEFVRFTPQERRNIVRIVCEQAGGRVPVLAGAAEANARETIEACEAYAGFGARAVAIVSPFYYRLSPESVYAYFVEIARNSPIDVTLYNIPMFASPIDVPDPAFGRTGAIVDQRFSGDLVMMRFAIRPVRPEFRSSRVGRRCWCHAACRRRRWHYATSGVVPELTRKMDLAIRRPMKPMLYRYWVVRCHALLADFPEAAVALRGFDMTKPATSAHPSRSTATIYSACCAVSWRLRRCGARGLPASQPRPR
jgi:4-hydroxy-tetrahydrodipicolinate synthase